MLFPRKVAPDRPGVVGRGAPTPALAPSSNRELPKRLRHGAVQVSATAITIAAVVAVWWLVSLLFHDPTVLPGPARVGGRFISMLHPTDRYYLVSNGWTSLKRVLLGWCLASGAGVAVGTAMASNRFINTILDPLVELARPIPPLAFTPLMIIWFGIGELPKVLIISFAAFFAVVIATVGSIRSVNPNWKRAALTLGATRMYILRHVTIPAALPGILTGMRIASGMAWGTLVAAELIASTNGLGWLILQAGDYLDTSAIFAGIVVIAAIAYLMDRCLRLVQHGLTSWAVRSE